MDYEQFDDIEVDSIEALSYSPMAHEQLLSLILVLNRQENIPLFCATYVVLFQGSRTVEQALKYIGNNDVNQHHYCEYDIYNQCAICQRDKKYHLFFEGNYSQIKEVVDRIKEDVKRAEPCSICYQWVFESQIVVINQQKHQICTQCFQNYLNVQIEEGKVKKLSCPHCDQQIQENIIKQYAPSIHEKYIRFLKNQEIATNPYKAWCPSVGCLNVVEFKPNQATEFCSLCKTEVCKECKQKAHPKTTCQENLQSQLEEWQLNRDTQQCPRCKYLVEKINGCNHMTCQFCSHEWCWICGSDYTSIHYAIFNPFGCPALMPGWIRQKDWGYTKLILWRVICFFLLLILTPVVVIAIAPVLCVSKVTTFRFFQNRSFCSKVFILFMALLLGIALIPVAIVAFVILLIPAIIFIIWFYYKERQRLEARHQSALSRHSQLEHNV